MGGRREREVLFAERILNSDLGFPARHAANDTVLVRDLVLEKMNALWSGKPKEEAKGQATKVEELKKDEKKEKAKDKKKDKKKATK